MNKLVDGKLIRRISYLAKNPDDLIERIMKIDGVIEVIKIGNGYVDVFFEQRHPDVLGKINGTYWSWLGEQRKI